MLEIKNLRIVIVILIFPFYSFNQVNDSILPPPVVKTPTPGVNRDAQALNLAWADTIITKVHKIYFVQLRPLCDNGKKRKTIFHDQKRRKKGCYTESVIQKDFKFLPDINSSFMTGVVKGFDKHRMYKWEEIDSTDYTSVFESTLGKRESRMVTMCYEPRHAVVFLDSKDLIMGIYEICFDCGNGKIAFNYVESISIYSEDYQILKKLFIKYNYLEQKKTKKSA